METITAASVTHTLTVIAMIAMLILTLIPYLDGPLFIWGLGLLYAIFTGLVPSATLIIMTLLMVAGVTSDYWLPIFGVRIEGMSCLGALGSLIGGILGTLLIPLPILGTIIGMIAGAMLIEFARLRQLRRSLQAGKAALKLYLWGIVVEVAFGLAILIVFIAST